MAFDYIVAEKISDRTLRMIEDLPKIVALREALGIEAINLRPEVEDRYAAEVQHGTVWLWVRPAGRTSRAKRAEFAQALAAAGVRAAVDPEWEAWYGSDIPDGDGSGCRYRVVLTWE